MSDEVLRLNKLSKSFGAIRALSDVDFTLYAGEISALVGDNACNSRGST